MTTPEECEERIRRCVAAAPPLAPEVIAALRHLLPPATPVTRTPESPRQEVAA